MNKVYPKWSELPNLDLYLDQVLLYVNQLDSSSIVDDDKGLTSAMINNYVKNGHLDKPIKKKYNRKQLARLIVITCLKNVFSIQEINYLNFVLNNKSYDNSWGIRNKYLHGVPIYDSIQQYEYEYHLILLILIFYIIKINEELKHRSYC